MKVMTLVLGIIEDRFTCEISTISTTRQPGETFAWVTSGGRECETFTGEFFKADAH
jgi:hypothetical protein